MGFYTQTLDDPMIRLFSHCVRFEVLQNKFKLSITKTTEIENHQKTLKCLKIIKKTTIAMDLLIG